MKYRAKPVIVEAFQITNVGPFDHNNNLALTLTDGAVVTADPGMYARMLPKTGDYYVIQNDGYRYLNPQHVFLSKYEPITTMGDVA